MRRHVREQTAALLRRLALQLSRLAAAGDADAVHDARVAIRRLDRCLRVFSNFYRGGSWKKVRAELKELRRNAGLVRDRDVTLLLLADAGVPPRAPIMARLAAERQTAARSLRLAARRWNRGGRYRHWRNRLEL